MIYQKELSYNNEAWDLVNVKLLTEEDGYVGVPSTVALLINSYNLHLLDTEYFFIAGYNGMDYLESVYLISKGSWTESQLYKREIGVYMLLSHCPNFRLFHNHPNGALFGSDDDKAIGFNVGMIAKMLGLNLKENYIITHEGYCDVMTEEITEFDI